MNQLIFDNPILIKHIRTRLSPPQSIYTGIVALVLCLCIMWAGWCLPAGARCQLRKSSP